MSGSTDSLKKKVCVTVFLDELFEEVLEEDRKDLKQVSELTGSRLKLSESTYKESPPTPLDNDEKVDVSPNADVSRSQALLRPRKHRRESKFSKNRDDSVKKELTKYGYGSCVAPRNECCEAESAASDSDMNLDEFLKRNKRTAESSKSSMSGLSEAEATEESFLSVSPIHSSVMTWNSNKENETSGEGPHSQVGSSILACDESARLDGAESEGEETGDDFPDEEEEAAENIPAWKATQKKIQFALAETESRRPEEEGDRPRSGPYDLRTILEECVKAGGVAGRKDAPVDSTDSYARVFPHDGEKNKTHDPEVERVWSGTRRRGWNDGFESDLSEADPPHLTKAPVLDDSLLCYILCLKCEEDVYRKNGKDENPSEGTLKCATDSESIGREPSFISVKSKSAKSQQEDLFRTLTQLANKVVLEAMLKSEKEEAETRNGNEGDIPVEACRRLPVVEGWNKNFAEGDTIEKPLSKDPNLILDFEANSKLLLCDEMFQKNVEDAKVIHHSIIVNRAEVQLGAREKAEGHEDAAPEVSSVPVGPTQILFRQTSDEFGEKNTTDVESELVFAESENSCGNETFSDHRGYDGPPSPGEADNEICILEFEDKLSRSKILRRMKTVEILGDASIKDMKNISTEVILICENISDNEVCLEAWHSNSATLRSITEMGQCYLKDSKDSAMYLIEIPLHFTKANVRKATGSEHLFKGTDSD